jgi:hypothetical protein
MKKVKSKSPTLICLKYWFLLFIFCSLKNTFGFGLTVTANEPRAGDRNPVLRLRLGYGACTLLAFRWINKISQ